MAQVKADTARGHATPAHEILFALALTDFSQYEYAVFLSGAVYAWGVPSGVKTNMIQVKTAAWIGNVKKPEKGYEALARLVERGVIRKTSKRRYIFNSRLSDWKDLKGERLFPPNGLFTAKLQGFMAARNYRPAEKVVTPHTGSNQPVSSVENDSPQGEYPLEITPHTGSDYSPQGEYDPPESRPQGGGEGALKAYLLNPVKESVNSVEFLETLQFARDVCKITQKKSIDDLKHIASEDGISQDRLRNSLEVLASKSDKPKNPLGLVRKLARMAKTHKLPVGAKTFDSWRLQQIERQEIRKALGTTAPKPATDPAKNAAETELANSFQTRTQSQQDEVIANFRRLRVHAPSEHWAEIWIEQNRPPWLSWHGGITKATFVLLEKHALKLFSEPS